jgi:hypothetical protein
MDIDLKQLLELREENAPISKRMEAEAVATKVMEWWFFEAVRRKKKMSLIDVDYASKLIDRFDLSCSAGDVEQAILARREKYMDRMARLAIMRYTSIGARRRCPLVEEQHG